MAGAWETLGVVGRGDECNQNILYEIFQQLINKKGKNDMKLGRRHVEEIMGVGEGKWKVDMIIFHYKHI